MFSATRHPYEHPTHLVYSCDQCNKEFSLIHNLNKHQRLGCVQTKRSLSQLLEDTKTFWESRKKGRLTTTETSSEAPASDLDLNPIESSEKDISSTVSTNLIREEQNLKRPRQTTLPMPDAPAMRSSAIPANSRLVS